MDYYEIIAGNFQSTVEAITLSVDTLADPIERACQSMSKALLGDGKIIACGNGVDAALAQLFVCNLTNRFECERPALPALSISSDCASITAIANSYSGNAVFGRQVRALGQPGDILLCINSGAEGQNLIRSLQAAHERKMEVVLLSNANYGELSPLIRSEDVEIPVFAARESRVIELQTMVIQCLSELIDRSLFGNYN